MTYQYSGRLNLMRAFNDFGSTLFLVLYPVTEGFQHLCQVHSKPRHRMMSKPKANCLIRHY